MVLQSSESQPQHIVHLTAGSTNRLPLAEKLGGLTRRPHVNSGTKITDQSNRLAHSRGFDVEDRQPLNCQQRIVPVSLCHGIHGIADALQSKVFDKSRERGNVPIIKTYKWFGLWETQSCNSMFEFSRYLYGTRVIEEDEK